MGYVEGMRLKAECSLAWASRKNEYEQASYEKWVCRKKEWVRLMNAFNGGEHTKCMWKVSRYEEGIRLKTGYILS